MHGATVLVAGEPFAETLAFFVDELGFALDLITPADNPSVAVVSGHGISLQIDRSVDQIPPTIRIGADENRRVRAPNGGWIEFRSHGGLDLPDLAPELVVSRLGDGAAWVTGRAGMRYRDLIPSRLGGRFIASHIEVCDGGPVPDMVHHHAIRFQMIFCFRGWVDVVYEDQGEPFRLEAGDCVLQPPHIRHRVIASSAGAQVVEIGCPAEHDTLFDHELELPTDQVAPDRDFGGQRFVRHIAADASWLPGPHPGFETQETAMAAATDGLAGARIVRADGSAATLPVRAHRGEFYFAFVLAGSALLTLDRATLGAGDGLVVPAHTPWELQDCSRNLALLEVTLPG